MIYTGNTDAEGQSKTRAGTQKFMDVMSSRWGFMNLGGYANRPMRSTDPKAPPRLSTHATGRAIDCGIPADLQHDVAWVSSIFDWLVENYIALGIEEVHQYWWTNGWGRGFRCNRKELNGRAGVKSWSESDNGGTPNGRWLHVELAPATNGGFADDPNGFVKAWKKVSASAPPPRKKKK